MNRIESAHPPEMGDPAPPPATKRLNPLKRLYHWVLSWADSKYGTPALAAISFAESSFFPIPPDFLQIALSVSRPKRSFYYAAVSAVASVLGGICGYMIGYVAWGWAEEFVFNYVPGFTRERFEDVGNLYGNNAFIAILAAAFTPIPYKVFTVTAGVFHEQVSLQTLIAASALGRSGRFFLVASVVYFAGDRAKTILEKNLEWITIGLFAALVGGYFAIKLML